MCGIFGLLSEHHINQDHLRQLAHHARQRGRDSSGLVFYEANAYMVKRADYDIKQLLARQGHLCTQAIMGHSRLITNGLSDNQPVIRDGICLIHNGIIVNEDEVWGQLDIERKFQIDSETIVGITLQHLSQGGKLDDLPKKVLAMCKGTISCAPNDV